MKRKRSIVWNIVWLLLLAPVLLLAVLQTPPGKAILASSLSSALSRSDNLEVRIGTISGWIPADVNIADLEIGDAQGVWLTAKELHFRWMIREVADERIRLKRLSAEEIELHRFPVSGKKEALAKTETRGFQPVEIWLDGLQVKRLKLGEAVAGIPLDYAVHSGGITLRNSGLLTGDLVVSGDAEGRVELNAVLAGNGADELTIKAELEQMIEPTFGLDYLSGQGEVTINAQGVNGRIQALLEKEGQQGRISAGLHYSKRSLRLEQFKFNSTDFSVDGDLGLRFSKERIDVDLNSTIIDAVTNRYDIHGMAVVAVSNKTWAVNVQTLEFHGWDALAFKLAGMVTPEEMELAGALEEFDVGSFPLAGLSNFTGRVNGQLSIRGSLERPQIVAAVEVAQFSSVSEALDELPELDFSMVGGVVDGKLFGSTTITNYSSGFFAADFALPCALSFAPFIYRSEPSKFSGSLQADLDVGIFNNLAVLENQFLKGALKADLMFKDLTPSGFLQLREGQYEHYDWGLVFRDLEADLVATKKGFEFKHAAATDGHAGEMSMSGGFGVEGLDIQLVLDGAKVVQRPEVEAQVSGQLALTGRVSHPEVKGTLVIDRAEILLDNMVAPVPPLLTNYDARAKTNTVLLPSAHKSLPFGMDIRVEMPDQVYIVASLIDSVWGGVFRVQDAPSGISVSGKMEPRRGSVNFIGKKFRFIQEGEVVLDGALPSTPVFNNLAAQYTRSDITARLVLNGRVNNPHYRLESTPAMPEDEILSQVLFNRDTTTISPYQAYQIATAAQQLSGGLNGPGFMYQFRQVVGVDTLEWREADAVGGASSVAAGKYITPGLYVEVSSSFDANAETGMMAEYEITRHFSVETSTGPKMRPGIGLNWKSDY